MTRLAIHVAKDLSSADPDPVNARVHRVGDVGEFEPGRHVGNETSLVCEVNELEGVLETDLEDDALGRVSVGSTVKGDLVESTEGGELDSPLGDGDVVRENRELRLTILTLDGGGEIIDKRRVEVVRRG